MINLLLFKLWSLRWMNYYTEITILLVKFTISNSQKSVSNLQISITILNLEE